MLRLSGLLLLLLSVTLASSAQDTLPAFSLANKGNNRIIISWTNPYSNIRQLSIQRSVDSTANFKSILTLPDPTVPQNGYADTKAFHDHMFYRLYILLDSGKYIFTKSKRPVIDTVRSRELPREIKIAQEPVFEPPPVVAKQDPVKPPVTEEPKTVLPEKKEPAKVEAARPKEAPEKIIFVKRRDTLIAQIGERSLRRFRDSIATRTRDTLLYNTADTLVIKTFIPKEVYRASRFVYTERDGNVRIALPLANEKKYTLKFFDDAGNPVFEIKQIRDKLLTLDKANFMRAGWFKFELYEDGVLKEKNKLYLPKEF
ncbi:MAG TPA: hypothetical protein VL307_13995 [Chitinophagaceae bacterium]|nr:hypothetical protein [Chitinophagaceae bacterium]